MPNTSQSKWVNIDGLGLKGMEADMLPYSRDPASLDQAVNVRPRGQDLQNAGGFLEVELGEFEEEEATAFPSVITTIFEGRQLPVAPATPEQRLVFFCGDEAVYKWDGDDLTDITGPTVDDGWNARWTGGWLAGAMVLANQEYVFTYKQDDASLELADYDPWGDPGEQTWEDLGFSARVFRPFRDYMVAGNVYGHKVDDEAAVLARYSSRVQWSDPVIPGEVVKNWVERDVNPDGSANSAGFVDLDDTPGPVVDLVPLRNVMVVYKEDSIHLMEYVGGNEVFSFRRIIKDYGIFARDAVVEVNGLHYGIGHDDLFVFDGNNLQSLAEGRIRETWKAQADESKARNFFTVYDAKRGEVVFHFVKKGSTSYWPDYALVYHLQTKSFWWRDYSRRLSHSLPVLRPGDYADYMLLAIDHPNKKLLELESVPTQNGEPTPAYIQRNGLFSDPGHDFVQVDQCKLGLSGNDAALMLGGQVAPDAAISWRNAFEVDPATDYKTDARQHDHLISYRIDWDTEAGWRLSNFALLVQFAGERG